MRFLVSIVEQKQGQIHGYIFTFTKKSKVCQTLHIHTPSPDKPVQQQDTLGCLNISLSLLCNNTEFNINSDFSVSVPIS